MVTISDEPPHYLDQLTIGFKFPNDLDSVDPNWAEISSPIGDLRIARLDTQFRETAIAAYIQNEPVALLKLNDVRDEGELPWLAIGKTSVALEHRRIGIMPALIELWLERSREPLLSDMRQSPDAYRMWARMACSTKTNFEILVWHQDGSMHSISCAHGTVTPDPAEGGDSTRWLARPRQPNR